MIITKKILLLEVILIQILIVTLMRLEETNIKKLSLAKLIQIKGTLYLCDIWRTRKPNVKRFTFWKNHVSGFIEQRLDFFLISNILQESIVKTDVLAFFCTDHSSIFFPLQLKTMPTRGKAFWKFNSSLTSNAEYVEK